MWAIPLPENPIAKPEVLSEIASVSAYFSKYIQLKVGILVCGYIVIFVSRVTAGTVTSRLFIKMLQGPGSWRCSSRCNPLLAAAETVHVNITVFC